MDAPEILGYLGALLNRRISEDAIVTLSSAQRARVSAWFRSHGMMIDDKKLRGQVFVGSLLVTGTSGEGASPAAARRYMTESRHRPGVRESGLSIGIDIQSVEELFRGVDLQDFKGDRHLGELFTMRELSYAQSSKMPMETLTGIFAAKEAVRKCMGGPELNGEEFREIEILPDRYGKPCTNGFEISISHSGGFAVAVSCRSIVSNNEESLIAGAPSFVKAQDIARKSEGRRRSIYKRALWVGGVVLLVESAALIALLVFK